MAITNRVVHVVSGDGIRVPLLVADVFLEHNTTGPVPLVQVVGSVKAINGSIVAINSSPTLPAAATAGKYAFSLISVNPSTGVLTTTDGTATTAATLGAFIALAVAPPAVPAGNIGVILLTVNGAAVNVYIDGYAQPVTQW